MGNILLHLHYCAFPVLILLHKSKFKFELTVLILLSYLFQLGIALMEDAPRRPVPLKSRLTLLCKLVVVMRVASSKDLLAGDSGHVR